MPLIHSGSKKAVSKNISEMVKAGHPQNQAVAAALNNQREYAVHKAGGGPVTGLLKSPVAGRTDRLPIHVLEDSYVIPADVVSGWGQGNTDAGGKLLDNMFNKHLQLGEQYRSTGGRTAVPRQIPIVAAGGEYIVHPSAVSAVGGGDIRKGHSILDKMVRSKRIRTAKHMQQLPGPRMN
jgi:hypothetical protein